MARPNPQAAAANDGEPLDQSRLEGLVGYTITRAEVRLRKLWLKRIEPYGLRPVDFSILTLIADNPGVNQRRVGDVLDVSPPNFAIVIDRLEKRNLVQRVRGTEDRRVQHLYLTDDGEQLLSQARAEVDAFERSLTEEVLKEDRDQVFLRVLQRLIAIRDAD